MVCYEDHIIITMTSSYKVFICNKLERGQVCFLLLKLVKHSALGAINITFHALDFFFNKNLDALGRVLTFRPGHTKDF